MELRSFTLIDTKTHREGRLAVGPPMRKVAACAVVANPLAGSDPGAGRAPTPRAWWSVAGKPWSTAPP